MTDQAPVLDRLRLLETLSKNNFGLIQLTDRKAQTLLRLVLTLFMVAFIGVPPAVVALKASLSDGGWMVVLFIAVVVLYALCATCLLAATIKIIDVIRPRIVVATDQPSVLYFGAVAEMTPEAFRETLHGMSYEETVEEMISQVHSTAVITRHKIGSLNTAVSWMMGGGIFGIVFALILLITIGLT